MKMIECSFSDRPFSDRLTASGVPTLDLPGIVLFPGEVVTLDVNPQDPLARQLEQLGDRPDLPPHSRVFRFLGRLDLPRRDASVSSRVCTLGEADFSEPSPIRLTSLARVLSERGGVVQGRNPEHREIDCCPDYPEARASFVKLLERSPGMDASAQVALLDELEAIEHTGGRAGDTAAARDRATATLPEAPKSLPIDVAADFIAVSLIRRIPDLDVSVQRQQEWLDILDPGERLRALKAFMVDVLEGASPEKTYERSLKAKRESWKDALDRRPDGDLGSRFLTKRLDDVEEQLADSMKRLRGRVEASGMPMDVLLRLKPELDGLSASTDAKTREYFSLLADLPWRGGGPEMIDIERVRRVLDQRHVGLREPKERILEHVAVRRRQGGAQGAQVLCFVGPPGAGKTSLAQSIAEALGRGFAEISCNGLSEVADVRGSRRDFAASQPGAVIRQLRKAGARNPVFLLDEIDKMGWPPGTALLDVLDPTRNAAFHDLYVDLPFDLSEVLFIATANVLDRIPPMLSSRMEAIELPGYSENEKFEIARRVLVPGRISGHGLSGEIEFEDEALRAMIRHYAGEMGVRDLDQGISAICRRTALRLAETPGAGAERVTVNESTVREVLGAVTGRGDVLPGVEDIRAAIERGGMPDVARRHATRELQSMLLKSPGDTSHDDQFTYLRCLTSLPWNVRDEERIDLPHARRLLDEGHWGLAKPKERLLEHLAVQKLGGLKGAVLCLVGPPGVGKTSLAQDVARAMGRQFARLSCAGLSDGTELRGHNRTWRAAQAGRFLREFVRIGSKNPVFVFDEIDKISRHPNSGGDPESVLLEVLDPQQNDKFVDNYVEVAFDLSEVFFVTTANAWDGITAPLQDRLEMIEVPGYSEDEKFEIARGHLVGRQLDENHLADQRIRFTEGALYALIRGYTREAGVRELRRRIGAVCRKVARRLVEGEEWPTEITEATVEDLLGRPPYTDEAPSGGTDRPGVATGLARTPSGGDTLTIEVARMPGRGKLNLTGQLGDVMQESARAAMSWVRANAARYGIDAGFYKAVDVHVHVPAGAIQKDGPSAGVAIVAALVSSLTGRTVRRDLAMTGEITLLGDVRSIGGVKEKLLAARRAGLVAVILPKRNEREVDELRGEDLLQGIEVLYVSTIEEMLRLALEGAQEA